MFQDTTFVGPAMDDMEILERLPAELAAILREVNGVVAFRGGLHVRGACRSPAWHSLRAAWFGPHSLAQRYRSVRADDIPFAEDALGDQFLLRGDAVWRLSAESDDIEPLGVTLHDFFSQANEDPLEYLSLAPLAAFEAQGGRLEPGQLLSVYPPLVTKADATGRSYRAIDAEDRLAFLAALASQIRDLPDGATIRFDTDP